jgi:hypothetical protein
MLFEFIILAVVVWAVLEYLAPKLPAPIGTVVTIIVVLLAIFWLLGLVGLVDAPLHLR